MRRRLLRLALLVATLAAASPAIGYWNVGGTGSGAGAADTLAAGNQPAASVSGQTVTVSWAQTAFRSTPLGGYGGGGYAIKRYPTAGGASVTPNTTCDTTISGVTATLSCLESAVPIGSWRYTVTPQLNSWTGAESTMSVSVDVGPPAPTLTSVVAENPPAGSTPGSIQLTWGAATGATGYNVYRRTLSGAYDFASPLNGATPLTTTTYSDPGSGLIGGMAYAYVVRAVAGTLQSADSNERSATAIARRAAPTGVTATPAPAGRIDVTWSSAAGAAGYNVYRRLSTGAYDYAAPLNGATPATGTSYGDTTAANGTTYLYVVRSVVDGAGGSQVESVDSAESAGATADSTSPTSVTLTNPGSPLRGDVTLSGTATGVANARFQYAPAGTTTWSDGCTDTTVPYSCPLATTTLADGLYDLRLLAVDGAGNTTASTIVTSRRIDNTGPSVTTADPGAYLRGTVTFTATSSDAGGSGVASVRLQRAPTGSGTWSDVCTDTTSPYSCSFNSATVANGGYDLRAIATDVAGNVSTSALVVNRVVDNTAPTGTNVQTTNVSGGTAGKAESGDVVTYTFSEPMKAASILAGWDGTSTPVTARFTNGSPDALTVFNQPNTTLLPLGSVASGTAYITATTTFSGSSMVLSGNTISVTLGTPSPATPTATGTTTLQWTTSTAATDRAGNPLTAGTIAEGGTADLDF